MIVRKKRFLLVLAALSVLAAGCGGGGGNSSGGGSTAQNTTATTAPTVRPAASVKVAILQSESTLTPYTYVSGYPGWNILTLIYDPLLALDGNDQPKPLLATAWTSNPEATVWTVTLRDGVKWQDGQPLTADDVKFSFEYAKTHVHSRWTGPAKTADSIDVNGNTVTFRLSNPNPGFPLIPMADMPIFPRHIWESISDPTKATAEQAIGSGPYRLADYKPDQSYTLKANPDYFLGKPLVDQIVLPIIKDPNVALSSVRSGEVDSTIRGLTPELVPQFQAAGDLKVAKGAGFASTTLQMLDERPPFTVKEVRQAVDYAIDKQKLVDTLLPGAATPGTPGHLHPALPLHDQSLTPRFDLAKAKSLLDGVGAKAGPDGVRSLDGKRFEFTLLVQSNQPVRIRAAELIAQMLKDAGFKINVSTLDSGAVTDKVWKDFDVTKPRDYDLAMFGWSAPVMIRPDPLGQMVASDPNVGSINIGGFRNADADRLVSELDRTVAPDRRQTLTHQLEGLVADQVPFVTLYYEDGVYAYRSSVYDGWTYQAGQGIFQRLSFLPPSAR